MWHPGKCPLGVPGSDTWVELPVERVKITFQVLPGLGDVLLVFVWETSLFSNMVFSWNPSRFDFTFAVRKSLVLLRGEAAVLVSEPDGTFSCCRAGRRGDSPSSEPPSARKGGRVAGVSLERRWSSPRTSHLER